MPPGFGSHPEGMSDNSPAIYRWVAAAKGRPGLVRDERKHPFDRLLSSVPDGTRCRHVATPTDKSVGYFACPCGTRASLHLRSFLVPEILLALDRNVRGPPGGHMVQTAEGLGGCHNAKEQAWHFGVWFHQERPIFAPRGLHQPPRVILSGWEAPGR
jgi:hypothetical protein